MSEVASASTEKPTNYYVPDSSVWPIVAAVILFTFMIGFGNFIQQSTGVVNNEGTLPGKGLFFLGLFGIFFVMYMWWKDTIKESLANMNSVQMDISYRQGMLWFIFSEVMFFAAFFGAFFYVRLLVIPWLGGEGDKWLTHEVLWPDFQAMWPLEVFPDGSQTQAMGAWGLPLINTVILVISSITLTVAHHALVRGERGILLGFHAVTVLLGIIFLGLQALEYYHAYQDMGLTLDAGIYGSTFFMLTGFHGLHVTIGTIFLIVLLIRVAKGTLTPENHFAYEAGAWYWHFVDVVWLFLFVCVYWM